MNKQKKGNPQKEDGYVPIACELAEVFCRSRISGQEWQVLWAILRKTYGWGKKTDYISLSQFQELTGLKKSTIIKALNKLVQKNIITKNGNDNVKEYGLNKHYLNWKLLPKKVTLPKMVTSVTQNGNTSLPKMVPTIDTNTTDTITKENKIYYNDGKLKNLSKDKIRKWQKAYPNENIIEELRKMESWLAANPNKQKKNYERFIVNWLSRAEQNYKKGGKNGRYIPINYGEFNGETKIRIVKK